MNKIYSKVWNKSLGMLVVASELAKSSGKSGPSKRLNTVVMAAGMICALGATAAQASAVDAATSGWLAKPLVETRAKGPANFERWTTLAQPNAIASELFSADGATDGSEDALALGVHSVAAGATSFAIGDGSSAYGAGSFASGMNSVAVGQGSSALSDNATAVGSGASAVDLDSTAVGAGSSAFGEESVALGSMAQTTSNFSTALGAESLANGLQSTAVGAGAEADGDFAAAFGGGAYASGKGTIAIGYAGVLGDESLVIGDNAVVVGDNSTGLGSNSFVLANNSVALGAGSFAGRDNTVSVGDVGSERQITNVAAGTEATDAVNVEQLNAVADSTAAASHLFSADGATDGSEDALALGLHSVAAGAGSFAIGDESAAYGAGSYASGMNSVAFGQGSGALNDNATAVGSGANATHVDSTAIGYASTASADNAVALGANSQADRANSVSVGSAGSERQIVNVAAGTAETDAVNKSQLDAVAAQVGETDASAVKYDTADQDQITLAGLDGTRISNLQASNLATDAATVGQLSQFLDALGGGGMLQSDGSYSMPNYLVQGGSYSNVGDALQAFDTALSGAWASIHDLDDRVGALESGSGPGGGGSDPTVATDGTDPATVAAGSKGVAVGSSSEAGGSYATAVGGDSYAAGPNDTAIGGNAKVNADGSTAVGANTVIDVAATNAVAVGESASVSAASGTAIGQGSSVTATGAVALGQGSVADRANTVSVGTAANTRQVTNVAAGTQATDAANVGQVEQALVTAKDYSDANDRQTLKSANAYTDQHVSGFATTTDVSNLRDQVNVQFHAVDKRINQVGAMGTAMSQMAFSTQGIDTPNRVGVGVGGYQGQAALSVGYSRSLSRKANLTIGAAVSGSEASGGVGVGFGW